jgi:ferredoxin
MSDQPLVDPDHLWSHSPDGRRDERVAYRLPPSEVLPYLLERFDFVRASAGPANDAYRRVIHREQYPQLGGPTGAAAPRPGWGAAEVEREVAAFVAGYASEHLESRAVEIGYTPVLPEHVYAGGNLTLPHVIVLGLPMRYEETMAAPRPPAGEEVTRNYMELGGLTLALSAWLRGTGYAAQPHHPRGDGTMRCEALFIPHAVAAGLGELGRHGSMISRSSGPRLRLSLVATDAPIPGAAPAELGVEEFCTWCTRCVTACPVDAIPQARTTRRGSYRFIVDTSACLPYFAETDGCGICVAVCPYNRSTGQSAARFADQVLGLEWVRRARDLRREKGLQAMERLVAGQRAAQGRRGTAGESRR